MTMYLPRSSFLGNALKHLIFPPFTDYCCKHSSGCLCIIKSFVMAKRVADMIRHAVGREAGEFRPGATGGFTGTEGSKTWPKDAEVVQSAGEHQSRFIWKAQKQAEKKRSKNQINF